MGRVIRVLSESEMFGPRPICGAMGGEPPPEPPQPSPCPPPPPSPTTEPHLVATPSGALVGPPWIEGSELHYIATGGLEYAGTGISISTPPGATIGEVWPFGEDIYYIDSSGVKRRLHRNSMGVKATEALEASMWLDPNATAGKQLQWVSGSTRYQWWNGL